MYYFRSIAIEKQSEWPPKISSFQFSSTAIGHRVARQKRVRERVRERVFVFHREKERARERVCE